MAVQMLPWRVADDFVKQYYAILSKCPEELYRFYHESSLLSWPGPDVVVTPVTTLRGIYHKIMSYGCKDWNVEIKTVDALESLEGGVIVAVTGLLKWKDNMKHNFSQNFFLAKQEKGFFVLNDILYIFDICGHRSITNSDDDKKVQKKVALARESHVTSPKAINQAVEPSTTKASTLSSVVPKSTAPASNVAPKLPISSNTAPNTTACSKVGAIYIGGLPYDVTKQCVMEVLQKFGPIKRSPNGIQLKIDKYGFHYGFVEFESTDAARQAVEARYVKFGEKEAKILYKRSFSDRGNGGVTNDGRSQSGCSYYTYENVQRRGPQNRRPWDYNGLGTGKWVRVGDHSK